MNYVKEYYSKIEKGEVVVCKETRAIYKRMTEEMDRNDESFPFYFREKEGERVVNFIETQCRHYQGEKAGELVKLELFQKAFVQCLFGWLEKDTNCRRFREYFFEVARKHGKSFLSACIAVYMLTNDGEAGAEVYTAATKLEQARIIYKAACNIIAQSRDMSAFIKPGRYETNFEMMKSVMKPLPSESKSLDGLNIHFAALDEIHEQKDRNMYDVLRQGMKGRKQPLIGCITTSGFRREGLYDSLHDYAVQVAMGTVKDDRFFPVIYKLDSEEEFTDPTKWEKANPGAGTIKSYVQLADDVERAKNDASYKPTLLVKDFCIKQNELAAWLPMDAIINETIADMDYLKKSYAIGGCDLSSTLDLTCSSLLLRKPNDQNFYLLQKYFIPQAKADAVEASNAPEAPYKLWAEQGWVHICEGASVSFHDVTAWFVEMVKTYNIRPLWVCYDRALAGYWQEEMKETGFELQRIAQGPYVWTYPMKGLEALLKEHRLVYQNNPVTRWCLCNTAKKSTNKDGIESIQPVKIQASRRIDGMVSLLNAYVGYVEHENEYLPYVR